MGSKETSDFSSLRGTPYQMAGPPQITVPHGSLQSPYASYRHPSRSQGVGDPGSASGKGHEVVKLLEPLPCTQTLKLCKPAKQSLLSSAGHEAGQLVQLQGFGPRDDRTENESPFGGNQEGPDGQRGPGGTRGLRWSCIQQAGRVALDTHLATGPSPGKPPGFSPREHFPVFSCSCATS